jgi:hypothetical protein
LNNTLRVFSKWFGKKGMCSNYFEQIPPTISFMFLFENIRSEFFKFVNDQLFFVPKNQYFLGGASPTNPKSEHFTNKCLHFSIFDQKTESL